MKKIIIFTDLDGTLLDYSTYSFEGASEALNVITEKGIPLIICSSKTRREIEYYRERLNNSYPFISENGGGIFIPKCSWFIVQSSEFKVEEDGGYSIIRLGARYDDLRRTMQELRDEGFNVRGFGDMTVEEVARLAGMSLYEAELAKKRDFDEPFIYEGPASGLPGLLEKITLKGFNYTEGRFLHILGDSDKGMAVAILTDFYRKEFEEIITVAIGDSPNDIPMLRRVDCPVVVRKNDGCYDERIDVPGLIKADGIGPEGWNGAVLDLLREIIL